MRFQEGSRSPPWLSRKAKATGGMLCEAKWPQGPLAATVEKTKYLVL